MTPITQALIPILALILAGFVIQRSNFLPATFWPSAEKLTYFLLMPAILIHSIANKQMADLPWFGMLVTVEGAVIVSAVLIISWWRFNRHIDGPGFTSAFQGAVRFNSFVALALAEKLFGAEGLFLAALGAGFMILLINVLCVSAFSVAVNEGRSIRPAAVLADLARNPLIIACVIGVSLNVSGLKLPQEIDGVLVLAGKAAFPIGLMAVGAAYRSGSLVKHWQPLLASSMVQFVCKPAAAWWIGSTMGLSGLPLTIVVLLFSVPTAPTSYILSRQMGGDHDSMASIITAQTCLSFMTLPITLWLLM